MKLWKSPLVSYFEDAEPLFILEDFMKLVAVLDNKSFDLKRNKASKKVSPVCGRREGKASPAMVR